MQWLVPVESRYNRAFSLIPVRFPSQTHQQATDRFLPACDEEG